MFLWPVPHHPAGCLTATDLFVGLSTSFFGILPACACSVPCLCGLVSLLCSFGLHSHPPLRPGRVYTDVDGMLRSLLGLCGDMDCADLSMDGVGETSERPLPRDIAILEAGRVQERDVAEVGTDPARVNPRGRGGYRGLLFPVSHR